jgi:hypothetical protein
MPAKQALRAKAGRSRNLHPKLFASLQAAMKPLMGQPPQA